MDFFQEDLETVQDDQAMDEEIAKLLIELKSIKTEHQAGA